MAWLRVQIDLGEISPEPVETALLSLGARSIHLSDGGARPILEPAPGSTPLWSNIRMDALFDSDDGVFVADDTGIMLTIAGAVAPAPMPVVRFSVVEDQDWIANWQQTLQPTQFGSKLWICPPDSPCPPAESACVRMQPGLAFGTGEHPTTALCLEWLDGESVAGRSVLDIGCGSGILSLAALALGAAAVAAVDNDPQALLATQQNAERNECLDRLEIAAAERMEALGTYDFVVANILSGTLIEIAPQIKRHASAGTRIALSGILGSQAEDVAAAYAGWVDFETAGHRGEWAILYGSVT